MQSNPHLVFGLVLIALSLVGAIPFLSMKTTEVKKWGLYVMMTGIAIGSVFVMIGDYEKRAAAQLNQKELSQDGQIVQKLLRGEEVPIEHYRTITALMLTARDELKLPVGVFEKIGDYRRYTIHFNTNDIVTVTSR